MKGIKSFAIGMLAFAFYSTPLHADITTVAVTSATISRSTGAITVSGTIVCTKGTVFRVFDNISQSPGGKGALTSGTASGNCSGGADTWIAPQATQFGSITPGDATVAILAFDSGGGSLLRAFHQPVTLMP
jgi:hypothetical protein